MSSKQRSKKDQEIHDLIMSLPADPNKPPLPPAPAKLEDAKTMEEVHAYLISSSSKVQESQRSSTTEQETP